MTTEPMGVTTLPPRGTRFPATEPSLLALASTVLRRRRLIGTLIFIGGIAGLAAGLLSRRQFKSTATLIPQTSGSSVPTGLLAAASQFGVRVPTQGSSWGPSVYVELLGSRDLLEPLAQDTVEVMEEGRRRSTVMDLLEIEGANPAERLDRAVRRLRTMVTATEDLQLGAVKLAVSTPWPSVSLALAQQAVNGVNDFNLKTRKSEAAAERQFAEKQAQEAQAALRDAEDRLEEFKQGNRIISSAPLTLQSERLQREVSFRQQTYSALVQSRDEARLREVRDTPVLTVLEAPRIPVLGESRKTVQKAVLGALAGAMIGTLVAFLDRGLKSARRDDSESTQEFIGQLDALKPRFLARRDR